MATISKKKTDKLGHMDARTIKGIGIHAEDATPVISFTQQGVGIEKSLPMTKEAWQRAANGAGATLDALRYGLNGASRYRFQILTDKIGKDKVTTVVGIHCIPDETFIQCDFATTLRRPMISREDAVVKIHPATGEIDVIAFPDKLHKNVNSFLAALEKLDTLDESTSFTAGGVSYVTSYNYGEEVTFRCRKIQR